MLDHNPFTTTPGIAGEAYINPHHAEAIIRELESPYSTQYVFKILGQRGSGKSVEYAKVMNHFAKKDNWKVYGLSAAGNQTETLVASMLRDLDYKVKDSTTKAEAGVEASTVLKTLSGRGTATVSFHTAEDPRQRKSDEATLVELCIELSKDNNILIGIDDIAKNDKMVEFLSIFGNLLLNSSINIRLICTGLYKNIEDFVSEDSNSLSFFVRPTAVTVSEIDTNEFTFMYMKFLGADTADAKEMAEVCKGYAWAYQLLGDILYNQKATKISSKILEEFDIKMASTYNLVWKTLTEAERKLLKILVNLDTEKRSVAEEIYAREGFGTIKQRLEAKHVIKSYRVGKEGYIKVTLPRLKEYIDEYQV